MIIKINFFFFALDFGTMPYKSPEYKFIYMI
jgi:hypothetical protein